MGEILKQFDDAIARVTQDRGAVYGHPAEDFQRAYDLKGAVRECNHHLIRHALEMICVKMARLTKTPNHLDSIIDIAGYARTMAMILDKEKEDHEQG